MDRIKRGLFNKRYMIGAFLIPVLIMVAACIDAGFYPFGDNQMAVIDMYHQYVPFLSELQYKLQSGGSLLYSWNGGAGTNFISLLAYYAASPLNLLLAIVPQKWLMEAVTAIVLIKIGLAGMFMNIYLKNIHNREDWTTVAFSTLYALCAYVVGYYWCFMWLDAVALLPLCILGLNRLMDRGQFGLYVVTLAAMMLTNYYIGGIMCIFILFYFPVLYFSKKRDLGVKGCLKKIGWGILCSFTGICISGIMLVPTFLSLKNTYYMASEMPKDTIFYRPILDILNNLLPQMEVTVRTGAPNIYCGIFCVILFAFYLMSKGITTRKKIANCAILAFLLLSFNMNKLDFLWHGFHFPNQIPFRYSFVVSFILVAMAYEVFLQYKFISPKAIAIAAVIGTGYVVVMQKIYYEDLQPEFAYVTLLLLFMYSGFLAVYRMDKFNKKLMHSLLLLIVVFEMVINVDSAMNIVGHTNRTEYFSECTEVKELVEQTKTTDKDFYRMEMYNGLTLNSPMLYNYPGVSQFSSTVTASVSEFLDRIGVEGGGPKNRYNYNLADPVTNSILGIKYFISRGRPIDNETHLELIEQQDAAYLYENKYTLDMGYMVKPALLYSLNLRKDNPFDVLNNYVKLSTDTDYNTFTPLNDVRVETKDVTIGEYINGYIDCSCSEDMEFGKVELTYTVPESQQVYAFVESENAQAIYAVRGDGTRVSLPADCGAVTSLGYLQAGDTVTVTIEYEEGQTSPINSFVQGFDENVWRQAYEDLSDETLKVTYHSDTAVEGTITAKEDGVCVLSIPYEKGWKVKVDGKQTSVSLLGDAFIAVPLNKGEHEITLRYMPVGLPQGLVLSLSGLGILAAMCYLQRKSSLKK